MGLLFRRKLPDGNIIDKYRVKDNEISNRDIIDICRELEKMSLLTRSGSRLRLEDTLKRSQSGGLDIAEVYDALQLGIENGLWTREQASKIALALGMEEKRHRIFKSMDAYSAPADHNHKKSGPREEPDKEEKEIELKSMTMNEIRMRRLKDSDPESSVSEQPKKDPHRLQKIADEKVREERERRFKEKLEETRRQREEHLNPKTSEVSKPESHNYESLSSLARRETSSRNDTVTKPTGEKSKSLQAESDAEEKARREDNFKKLKEQMKARRLGHESMMNPGNLSERHPGEGVSDGEDSHPDFNTKPKFKF